jgi:hypothetical protein
MSMPAAPVMGHIIECKQCHKTAVVTDGQHIHDALQCKCCPDHSSAHTVNAPSAEEGGVPCRPVTVWANAFVSLVELNGAGA